MSEHDTMSEEHEAVYTLTRAQMAEAMKGAIKFFVEFQDFNMSTEDATDWAVSQALASLGIGMLPTLSAVYFGEEKMAQIEQVAGVIGCPDNLMLAGWAVSMMEEVRRLTAAIDDMKQGQP